MEITVKLPTLIYGVIMILLILLTIYPRETNSGYINTSGCANILWLLISIVFTLIYGGFYFW